MDVAANINKEEGNRVDFEFYEKPSRNKRIILENAALPSQQKRTILTQECLRRLRNTKVELGRETQVKHLINCMLKLKNSGYSVEYRKNILKSALNAFDQMCKDDQSGLKPLYRDREWNKSERNQQKQSRKLNWYKDQKKNRVQVSSLCSSNKGR